MSDGRTDRLKDRFGNDPGGDSEGSSDDVDETPSETDESADAGGERDETTTNDDEGEPKWVNMRLPKALADELDLRYRRLDLEARESGGEGIEKNTDFYPAVVRAGLEHVDLDDVRDE